MSRENSPNFTKEITLSKQEEVNDHEKQIIKEVLEKSAQTSVSKYCADQASISSVGELAWSSYYFLTVDVLTIET